MRNKQMCKFCLIICNLSLILIIAIPLQGFHTSITETPVWERVYERYYLDAPTQLIETPDGGYILIGSQIIGGTTQVPWILKVDSNGYEEWNQSYTPPNKPHGHLRSIATSPDGGYVLAGFIRDMDRSTWDLWILKIDSNGVEVWNRSFNGIENGPDYGAQIQCTSDNGFLVSGATQSEYALPTQTWNTDYWLIKTNAEGKEEWNKTYHRLGSDQGSALISLNDGNYLLSGLSKQSADLDSAFSIWVIKVNENGTIIWDKHFEQGTAWYGAWERSIIGTADGGFLLACYPFGDIYTIGKDYWILKCNAEGTIEWETSFGGEFFDTPTACLQSPTGDYYIGGSYNSTNGSFERGDMCIVRLNSSGDIQGYITYGKKAEGERIVDMIFTEGSDSSEAIISLASVENGGLGEDYLDFWLGKFDNVNSITTTTTTTEDSTNFADLLIIFLGIGIFTRRKIKKKHR
ncbi:MAG: hypothetical protein ACFFAJ_11475 [Candidatus Hodarchaeota archaeon]